MADFKIDPSTGDYVIANGSFVLDDTPLTAMILSLRDRRGAWWADVKIGSRIDDLFQGRPAPDPAAAVEAAVSEALRPLVQRGRLQSFEVDVTSTTPLQVSVRARAGREPQPIVLTLQPVG